MLERSRRSRRSRRRRWSRTVPSRTAIQRNNAPQGYEVERFTIQVPIIERVRPAMERGGINTWSELEITRVEAEGGAGGWGETIQHYTWVRSRTRSVSSTSSQFASCRMMRISAFCREFRGWHVNMQSSMQRPRLGFDHRDHPLDILVDPDRSWQGKHDRTLAIDEPKLSAKS